MVSKPFMETDLLLRAPQSGSSLGYRLGVILLYLVCKDKSIQSYLFYCSSVQREVQGANSIQLEHQLRFVVVIFTVKCISHIYCQHPLINPWLVSLLLHIKDTGSFKFTRNAQRVRSFSS